MKYSTHHFRTLDQKWGLSQASPSTGGVVDFSFALQNFEGQFVSFDSFMTESEFQSEIIDAFGMWETVTNIRFREVPDNANVDIRLGWAEIDEQNGILGDATVPSSGPLASVIIRFDSNEDWFVGGDASLGQKDFSYVATHEIGHGIGIDHSNDASSLMFDAYNDNTFNLQADDIDAAQHIYGDSPKIHIDIYRFFNNSNGGHFFTPHILERDSVEGNINFRLEGIGFDALDSSSQLVEGAVPVYRFFNQKTGGHFFTAFEEEKEVVLELENFIFEGESFRAFEFQTSSNVPVHRFFNKVTGGHLFTVDAVEKTNILGDTGHVYEGVGFYGFADAG
jgi:hypothetical protein